jgi:hypothetical protein
VSSSWSCCRCWERSRPRRQRSRRGPWSCCSATGRCCATTAASATSPSRWGRTSARPGPGAATGSTGTSRGKAARPGSSTGSSTPAIRRIAGCCARGRHEGDWEFVQLRLDAIAHPCWRRWPSTPGRRLPLGRARAEAGGGHEVPVVYGADGSHASYSRAGARDPLEPAGVVSPPARPSLRVGFPRQCMADGAARRAGRAGVSGLVLRRRWRPPSR